MNEEAALAVRALGDEMRVLWPPPKTVKTAADAEIYLAAWMQTILDESKDADEIRAGWRDLRRLHKFACWPTAGEVCERIRQLRRDYRGPPPAGKALPPPDYVNEVWTPAQWKRHLEAMKEARAIKGRYGTMLVKLGEAMMARQERNAERRAPA
ncbi:MAG: hypothetical protein ACREEE_05605 [Dongiaceae bacterium]